MKPDWEDAPAWAQWRAQCKDGYWIWFRSKPRLVKRYGYWTSTNPTRLIAGFEDPTPDWTNTLEERP